MNPETPCPGGGHKRQPFLAIVPAPDTGSGQRIPGYQTLYQRLRHFLRFTGQAEITTQFINFLDQLHV